jgi:CRP/FNR family transcriptional regulator, cyclic AMP receptor protein
VKCENCQTELAGEPKYCSECGQDLQAGTPSPARERGSDDGDEALKLPSGFSRTLSTDLVAKQIELRTLAKLATLVQSRTYRPGEIMIHQGETSRDLFFLTEGVVEISRKGDEGDLVLNEIEPPYILGDVAFLFGMPRTATATAKTEVKVFLLRHEDLKDLLKELPPWVHPLLTSLASDMKSLHHKTKTLEKRLAEADDPSGRKN